MNESGIYAIRRSGTDQCYVGSTQALDRRWKQHRACLQRGVHDSPRLQYSWNKHGEPAFSFEVLEHCSVDALMSREQSFIDDLKPVFNSGLVVGAHMRGRRHSAEAKAKMRAASSARWTPEARAKMSEKLKGKRTALGCKRSPENIEAMRRRATGKTHIVSDDARRLMSLSQMGNRKAAGRIVTPETRAKLSAALNGRVFKPETIARMRAGQSARRARAKSVQLATGSI